MYAVLQEERQRKFARKLIWFSSGATLFSLFNLARFGRLSPSGRGAALFGTLFFSMTTYVCYAKATGGLPAVIKEKHPE